MSELKAGNRVLTSKGMGTVSWTDGQWADVKVDGGLTYLFEVDLLDVLDYQADRDLNDSEDVWVALNFIQQLRQRGDEPGDMMADILEPLAEAYKALRKEQA